MRVTLWAIVAVSSLFGAAGNLAMKLVTNRVGEITLARFTDLGFLFEFVFLPLVIVSVAAAFVGRFLLFVPMSEMEVGIVTAVALMLWALFTAIGDVVVFDTEYSPILLLGLVLSGASIYIFVVYG